MHKRKNNTTQCNAHNVGATHATMGNSGKRRKLEGSSQNRNGSHFRKALLTCYSNFKESAVPQRLMFYQNEEWIDFAGDLLDVVRRDLQEKKAAIEVKFNGKHYLLDFLHMFRLDLATGFQQPIAWIDEAGKCFFPEIYANDKEAYSQRKNGKNGEHLTAVTSESHEIKLQLEIDINGLDKTKLEEGTGGPNAQVKRIKIGHKPASNQYPTEIEDSCNKQHTHKANKNEAKNKEIANENVYKQLDCDIVWRTFLEGMTSFCKPEIVDVYRCSSKVLQSRFELFQKQIEITRKHRGSEYVKYAWLASSEQEISKIVMYGIGHCGPSALKSLYGVGVHLTSARCPHASSIYCEANKNGVRHMVLCRVILGKLEVIHPGSKQFHPSSEDVDSGVDDLINPRHYIVWSMNMNTHIFPEFVISFKISTANEGHQVGSGAKHVVSGPTMSCHQVVHGQLPIRSSVVPTAAVQAAAIPSVAVPRAAIPIDAVSTGNVAGQGSATSRAPKSPWMPFPALFAALSCEVSHKTMEEVNEQYQLFKARKVTRDDFVKVLRSIVGDDLLRTKLTTLQSEFCRHSSTPETLSECQSRKKNFETV